MDRQVPEHGTWSQSPKDLTPFHRSQRGAMANGGLTVTPFHPATLGTRIPSSSPAATPAPHERYHTSRAGLPDALDPCQALL